MPTLFGLLNAGRTALMSHQRAMSVTGENLANVHTPGYVRRRVVLEELPHYSDGKLYYGTGVDVKEVERVIDKVLDRRLSMEKGEEGFWKALYDVAKATETVFNEPKEMGLSDVLNRFWNAWQALATSPDGTTERDAVVERALNLVGTFKEVKRALEDAVNDGVERVKDWVNEVNETMREIASLNKRLKEAEIGSKKANDLRDRLSYNLKKLSELTGASYTFTKDGVQVFLDNGVAIVEGSVYRPIEFQEGSFLRKEVGILNDVVYRKETLFEKEYLKLTVAGEDVSRVIKGKIGGTINGLINIADHYLAETDRLATEIIYHVNSAHVAGIGLEHMTSITSEVAAGDPDSPLKELPNLYFRDRLKNGAFELRVWDEDGNLVTSQMINVNPDDTLREVVERMDKVDHVEAYLTDQGAVVVRTDSGYTLSFGKDTSGFLVSMGINTFFSGDRLDNMDVSERIKSNHMFVAAGSTPFSGDNRVALEVANLAFEKTMDGGNRTFGEFYDAMVGEIGAKTERIHDIKEDTEKFVDHLEDMWQSVSGINIDEEMTNLMKFQRAYEAAARYVTAVDEMMNRIINGMGVVGR